MSNVTKKTTVKKVVTTQITTSKSTSQQSKAKAAKTISNVPAATKPKVVQEPKQNVTGKVISAKQTTTTKSQRAVGTTRDVKPNTASKGGGILTIKTGGSTVTVTLPK